jgi:hypothetical protein
MANTPVCGMACGAVMKRTGPGPVYWLLAMDVGIPERFMPALRIALWASLPFIFLLIGVERYFNGTIIEMIGCFICALLSIFVIVYWDRFIPSRFRPDSLSRLKYLSDRDSQLESAIISMARQSAWGRWYAAQCLVNSGIPIRLQHLYQAAAGQVMQQITDGALEVRGRRSNPERLEYEPICVPVQFALKIILVPKGIVEIDRDGVVVRADNVSASQRTALLDYDSLLVDAYQFENLWPKNDALADKKRRQLLRVARKRGLDKNEIQRLSKD